MGKSSVFRRGLGCGVGRVVVRFGILNPASQGVCQNR